MTFRHLLRPAFLTAAAAVALSAALLSGHAAQAFTFNNADGSSGNDPTAGYSHYKDIDVTGSRLNGDSDDKSTPAKPKSGFYFGGASQSMDQRYSGDRYFSPNSLMGR